MVTSKMLCSTASLYNWLNPLERSLYCVLTEINVLFSIMKNVTLGYVTEDRKVKHFALFLIVKLCLELNAMMFKSFFMIKMN